MDNKEKDFIFIKCPFCKIDLKFKKEPKGRRVHTLCKNCMKEIEITIK